MKKIIILILVVLVAGVGVWWMYGNKNKGVKYSGPMEKVSIKLKWLDQAQFAGNYVAMEKGYYKDLGLDVSLVPFSFEETTIETVLAGKADFGIAGADELLVARSIGKPVKAIAVIYKINPGALFVLKDSGISKPQDFVGKRIGLNTGVTTEYLYQAMMNKIGVDRKKVTEVAVGYDYHELFDDSVDALVGYSINLPEKAVTEGREVEVILMADYGVNMYADVLFTTDEMIESKPSMVERMVKATLDGWQYVVEHKDAALDISMKYVPEGNRELQEYMLNNSIPLIYTGRDRLGWMTFSEWEKAQEILFEQKVISKKSAVSDVFTMQFLEAVYK